MRGRGNADIVATCRPRQSKGSGKIVTTLGQRQPKTVETLGQRMSRDGGNMGGQKKSHDSGNKGGRASHVTVATCGQML